MKQPAINNIFAPTKHYSQTTAAQDKDYIVLARKDDKDGQMISSQKTATSTKRGKGSVMTANLKKMGDEGSMAAADTLSLNSNTKGAKVVSSNTKARKSRR